MQQPTSGHHRALAQQPGGPVNSQHRPPDCEVQLLLLLLLFAAPPPLLLLLLLFAVPPPLLLLL
ncbi:hypothetical protein AB0P15_04305, partial [Streptomyces sp. NPDC087917]|uniref:hypothetical protein n=1 Tax=Streptomyces sp. NPDC087917 TaxID=3155060 RepID=UPI00342E9405